MPSDPFPLPLTTFETYMLADHRPEYPMVFYLRLRFTGRLERAKLATAAAAVLARHPLLRATVREIEGRPWWVAAEPPKVAWRADDPSPPPRTAPLDLHSMPGLRMEVTSDEAHDYLLLEFHHVSCDGIAAVAFVEELLVAYHAEHKGLDPDPRPLQALDPAQLRQRARLGMTFWRRLRRRPLAIITAWGLAEFFTNRPTAVAAPTGMAPGVEPSDDGAGAAAGPGCVSRRVGAWQLVNLRRVARRLGVTVNDLLIRDLLSTILDWNQLHQPPRRPELYRITVPVNMREASDAGLSAANVVSMFFIDRRPGKFASPTRLLRSVVFDTRLIKRFRLGLIFLWVAKWLCRLRPVMRRLMDGRRCMSTAVMSNLGVQFDQTPLPRRRGRILCGDVLLAEIEFLPPLRPLTRVAVGAITYAGELNVTLHYDRGSFTRRAAQAFLASLVRLLTATATGRRDACPLPALSPRHRRPPRAAHSTAGAPDIERS